MRTCPKCRLSGDDASFYPSVTSQGHPSKQRVCRSCVDEIRQERYGVKLPEIQKVEREQAAIRTLVAQLQPVNTPFVYLLDVAGQGYKIGHSHNVAKRVATLNTSFSQSAKLIAVAPGGREIEKALHIKFANSRITREWFLRTGRILTTFKDLPGGYVFLPGYMSVAAPVEQPD